MSLYSKEERCVKNLYNNLVNIAYQFNSFPKDIKLDFQEFISSEEFKEWEQKNKIDIVNELHDVLENLNNIYKQLD